MSIKKQRTALKVLNDHLARRGFKHNLEGGVDGHGFLVKEPGSRNVMASHALLRSIWRHAMDSAEAAKMELGEVIFSLYSENTAKHGLMPSFQNGVDQHNFYLDSDVDVQIFSKDGTPIPRFFTSVVFRGNILQKVLKDIEAVAPFALAVMWVDCDTYMGNYKFVFSNTTTVTQATKMRKGFLDRVRENVARCSKMTLNEPATV